MPGLYLHIPFCKKACHYCNFHFSTSLQNKSAIVDSIIKEIELQRDYLPKEKLTSIYFGGGTPSLLSGKEIELIFNKINSIFGWTEDAEITLEANPDDLSLEKLSELSNSPINRLSIGVQSFFDNDLIWMNRAHNSGEAKNCIENSLKTGFENLTIDLIYGSPTTDDFQWKNNLKQAFSYGIKHLSCYALTVEKGTALHHLIGKKKHAAPDEETTARQFELLMELADNANYEQYEISNFAQPGFRAKHNSAYWKGEPYLGVGPSAHSFNGHSRQWNVANNAAYLLSISDNKIPFELENLTPEMRYHEYVLTRLRTVWGCQLTEIEAIGNQYATHFEKNITQFIADGLIRREQNSFFLTRPGKLLSDRISMELFV